LNIASDASLSAFTAATALHGFRLLGGAELGLRESTGCERQSRGACRGNY
jgi:hypothetical protein